MLSYWKHTNLLNILIYDSGIHDLNSYIFIIFYERVGPSIQIKMVSLQAFRTGNFINLI